MRAPVVAIVVAAILAAAPAARAETITGLVFADANRDGLPNAGEAPVANAVVAFGIANYTVTDATGRYTLIVPTDSHGIVWVRVPDGFAPGPVWASWDGTGDHLDLAVVPLAAPIRGPLTFVVAADSHIHADQARYGLTELINAAQQATAAPPDGPRPAFFTILGDITQGNRDREFDLVDTAVAELDVPWVPVPGNHDWYDGGTTWFRRYGPDNYSFDIDGVHFVVWNMAMPEDDIRAYLGAELARVDKAMTIVALTHGPPSVAVTSVLRELGVRYVLTGHTHTNRVLDHDGVIELNTEPFVMGGLDFTPAGYRVVTIDRGVLTSEHHAVLDAPVVEVAAPAPDECAAARDGELVIAAELDGSPTAVTATIDCGPPLALTRVGGWSWRAALPELEAGAHAVHVEASTTGGALSVIDRAIAVCRAPGPPTSGSWPQLGGDAGHTGARAAELAPPLVTRWTAAIGGHALQAAPVVAGGRVFVTATDLGDGNRGGVVALDAATGAVRWRARTPLPVRGGATIVGDVVVVAELDGLVLGLDVATGAERWRVELADLGDAADVRVIPEAANVYASPVADHGDVLIANQRALAAIHAATGTVMWTADPSPGAADFSSIASLAVGDGVAIGTVNRAAGGLIGWDRETGHELWRLTDPRAIAIHASPVIVGDTVFVANGSDQVVALDAATGVQRWLTALDPTGFEWGNATVGTPAVAHGIVVVPTLYRDLVALDARSGVELWRHTAGPSRLYTTHYRGAREAGFEASPVITGGIVWIAGTDGALVALDLTSGSELWRTEIGEPVLAGAAVAGDQLVVTSFDGTVRALAPPSAPAALPAAPPACTGPARRGASKVVALIALGALLTAVGVTALLRRGRR